MTNPATRKSLDNRLIRQLDIQRRIQLATGFAQNFLQGIRLFDRSRETVQQKTLVGRQSVQAILYHGNGHGIGNQRSLINI